jgi:hypothetical protein
MRSNLEFPRSAGILLCGFALVVAGCASIHKEINPLPDTTGLRFEDGKTHYHDVLDDLGPPSELTTLPGGFAFLYESLTLTEKQFGISSLHEILRYFKLALADSDVDREVLFFRFGEDGNLRAHGRADISDPLGMGVSIQFIISVLEVADTSEYERDFIDENQWGSSMFAPLPVSLNAGVSLESGNAGIEQRGTPRIVGQRTLEMR